MAHELMLASYQQQAACHSFLLLTKSYSKNSQSWQVSVLDTCNRPKAEGATIHSKRRNPLSHGLTYPATTGATPSVTIAVTELHIRGADPLG